MVQKPGGAIWYTQYYGNDVAKITNTGQVTTFPLPSANSEPDGLTVGSDGALWFTEAGASQIGRITTSGAISEYPTLPTFGNQPTSITTGSDGNLWYSDDSGINVMSPKGTILATYPVTPAQITFGLMQGPDGAVWFIARYAGPNGSIGRITPQGAITYFPMPASKYPAYPSNLVVGADGNIWFCETKLEGTPGAPAVVRVSVPSGTMTSFADSGVVSPSPFGGFIAVGKTVNGVGTFYALGGQVDPSQHAAITEFNTNGQFIASYPGSFVDDTGNILVGTAGNVWFSSSANTLDPQSMPTYIDQLILQ